MADTPLVRGDFALLLRRGVVRDMFGRGEGELEGGSKKRGGVMRSKEEGIYTWLLEPPNPQIPPVSRPRLASKIPSCSPAIYYHILFDIIFSILIITLIRSNYPKDPADPIHIVPHIHHMIYSFDGMRQGARLSANRIVDVFRNPLST